MREIRLDLTAHPQGNGSRTPCRGGNSARRPPPRGAGKGGKRRLDLTAHPNGNGSRPPCRGENSARRSPAWVAASVEKRRRSLRSAMARDRSSQRSQASPTDAWG